MHYRNAYSTVNSTDYGLASLWTAVNLVKKRFIVKMRETDSKPCLVRCKCKEATAMGAFEKGMPLIFQGFNLNFA